MNWTTGKPKTALTGTTSSNGDHNHAANPHLRWHGLQNGGGSANLEWDGGPSTVRADDWTQRAGNHTHTVTINGGDAETAPDHARVVRCIKAFHITMAKPAPDQLLTALTAPTDGQTLLYDASTSSWKNGPVHAGNGGDLWVVGSIQQSILTEPQWTAALGTEASKWALVDGRDVSGSKYATLTGRSTIPDLRGAFMRMAGVNSTNTRGDGGRLGTYQEDLTARPKTALTGNTSNGGAHDHGLGTINLVKTSGGSHNLEPGSGGAPEGSASFRTDGAHAHTVTINGGGDAETRPKTYSVNYFIKIN